MQFVFGLGAHLSTYSLVLGFSSLVSICLFLIHALLLLLLVVVLLKHAAICRLFAISTRTVINFAIHLLTQMHQGQIYLCDNEQQQMRQHQLQLDSLSLSLCTQAISLFGVALIYIRTGEKFIRHSFLCSTSVYVCSVHCCVH